MAHALDIDKYFRRSEHSADKNKTQVRIRTTQDFGKYINHSPTPNSALVLKKEGWVVVAIKNINTNTEIVGDYNDKNNPKFIGKFKK